MDAAHYQPVSGRTAATSWVKNGVQSGKKGGFGLIRSR
jgi:hypothetical protein